MRLSVSLTLILLTLLQGCQTAPRVVVQAICPKLPELEQVNPAVLEQDYTKMIANFLRGSLETPPNYRLDSKPVTGSMKLPVTN